MKSIPEVSVILPTYNRAGTLVRSIQSVLSQSVTDIELIVVDDASEDDTKSVIDSFGDRRIKYIKNSKNVGGAEARNIGIRNACAQLIAFQDSDDEWRPLKLERCLIELRKNSNLLGVYSAFWQIDGKKARYMPQSIPPGIGDDMTKALLWGNFVGTPTVVTDKESIEACGYFDKDMPRYQDWELFIRLSELGPFSFIEEPLILSYCMPNNITSNNLAHQKALERIYGKNKFRIESNKKLQGAWLARIGDAQMRTGSPDSGRRYLCQSFASNPFSIRHGLKALFAMPGNRWAYTHLNRFFEKKWA